MQFNRDQHGYNRRLHNRSQKKKLNGLESYCIENELQVNENKTKNLPFHRGRLKMKKFLYTGKPIEIVNRYQYLGTIFSWSRKFRQAAQENLKKGKTARLTVNNILSAGRSCNLAEKMKLLESVVNATSLYSTEIWGLREVETLEKYQLNYIKSILSCPRNTSKCMVKLEAGICPIAINILKRTLNWWGRILHINKNRYPRMIYDRLCKIDNWESNREEYNWSTQPKIY